MATDGELRDGEGVLGLDEEMEQDTRCQRRTRQRRDGYEVVGCGGWQLYIAKLSHEGLSFEALCSLRPSDIRHPVIVYHVFPARLLSSPARRQGVFVPFACTPATDQE